MRQRLGGPPFAGDRFAAPLALGEAQSEPALRVAVDENAGRFRIDANEVIADSVRAINAAERLLKFVVGDCPLEFRERIPVRRICQRVAEMIGGASGGEGEEEGEEDAKVRKTRDHGLDFRLFNTMLARC